MLKESTAVKRQKTRHRIPMPIWLLVQQIENPQKQKIDEKESAGMNRRSYGRAILFRLITILYRPYFRNCSRLVYEC